jgi:hypothetical protein
MMHLHRPPASNDIYTIQPVGGQYSLLFMLKCAPEVIAERIALFEEDGTPRTEAVTKDDREHSQWYDRNTMWLVGKGSKLT